MLICRSRVVCYLRDPIEQVLCLLPELLFHILRNILRPRDVLDKRVDVEGVDLVEAHYGDHQPVTRLRWCDRSSDTDDYIDVRGAGAGANGLHQQIEVQRVTRLQDV